MCEFKMQSGDDYADAMLERRLAGSPEYWALVDYLEEKGLLNRGEFQEYLLRRLEEYVDIVKQAHVSQGD